tara:strand:- start:1577 stop:2632 length:1056 start_codon:yes stop_codon:yes gene_type:complete
MAEIRSPLNQVLVDNLNSLRRRNYAESDLKPGGVLGLYEGLSSPDEGIRRAASERFGVKFVPNDLLEKGKPTNQEGLLTNRGTFTFPNVVEAKPKESAPLPLVVAGTEINKDVADAIGVNVTTRNDQKNGILTTNNNANQQTKQANNTTNSTSNIFGDVISNALFPFSDIAQGKIPDNKAMINAAILRGSLELLKPRQAGENFASQASRALEAGLKPAASLADYQLQMAKIKAAGQDDYVQTVKLLSDQFTKDLATIQKSVGIIGDFRTEEGALVRNIITDEANVIAGSIGAKTALERQKELLRELPKIKRGEGGTYSYDGTDPTIERIVDQITVIGQQKNADPTSQGGFE